MQHLCGERKNELFQMLPDRLSCVFISGFQRLQFVFWFSARVSDFLLPELKLQMETTSDQDKDDRGTEDQPGKWRGSLGDVRETDELELQNDGAGTSGVSTLSRSVSYDSQQNISPLITQLSRLRAETNRYEAAEGTWVGKIQQTPHHKPELCWVAA